MVIFSHSRDFPLYFWWFIFNFGCIPRTSCCVRIVLYFVVLTLYEMECVKPVNPTVTMVIFSHSRDFLFISNDSSLILVAYLVHWVLRRDIRSRRRSSINSAGTTELSTVRYLLPGLHNRVQKYPLFRSSSPRYCCWSWGCGYDLRWVILQSVCRILYVQIRGGLREYYTRAWCVHSAL